MFIIYNAVAMIQVIGTVLLLGTLVIVFELLDTARLSFTTIAMFALACLFALDIGIRLKPNRFKALMNHMDMDIGIQNEEKEGLFVKLLMPSKGGSVFLAPVWLLAFAFVFTLLTGLFYGDNFLDGQ